MNRIRLFLLVGLLAFFSLIAWLLVSPPLQGTSSPIEREANVDQNFDPAVKAKFDRLAVGMTLEEAENIMGPAGLSYSSQLSHEYYIWKTDAAWVTVIIGGGKVTSRRIHQAP